MRSFVVLVLVLVVGFSVSVARAQSDKGADSDELRALLKALTDRVVSQEGALQERERVTQLGRSERTYQDEPVLFVRIYDLGDLFAMAPLYPAMTNDLGSSDSARVIWTGITTGAEDLDAVAAALDNMLAEIDFRPENRKFSAHLTLARIKNAKVGRQIRKIVDQFEPINLGCLAVNSITVFQSELTPSGPIYTPLHHAKLAPSP